MSTYYAEGNGGITLTCPECGERFEAKGRWQRLCWDCWRAKKDEDVRQEAYEQGRRAGRAEAQRSAPPPSASYGRVDMPSDAALLLDIIQLTHPDRHPPERAALANRVTAALNVRLDRARGGRKI